LTPKVRSTKEGRWQEALTPGRAIDEVRLGKKKVDAQGRAIEE